MSCISFSRGSSPPRDWTCISCIGWQIIYHWATREAPISCLALNLTCVFFSQLSKAHLKKKNTYKFTPLAAFVNKVLLRYMLICLHVIHDFFVLQQQSSAVAVQIVKETMQPAKPKWPVQMHLNSTVSSVIPSGRALYFNPLRPECCTKESLPGCT